MRLAELLATRMCHDLSGPLNTLMGALEIVNEDPEAAPEALPLAGDASVALGQRLKLMRAAWGGSAGPMALDEIAGLAAGLPGRNLRLDMGELHAEHAFSPGGARLLLNALMLAAEALPGGGTIHLSGDSRHQVMLQITGNTAAWPSGFIGYLANAEAAEQAITPDGPTTARTLQAPLTALLARHVGMRISVLLGAGTEAAPPLLLDLEQPN